MNGELTGVVLSHEVSGDKVILTLAGITPNDKSGVTWIHHVRFSGKRVPKTLPRSGQVVRVPCIAAQEIFTGRSGEKASRVVIHGLSLNVIQGRVMRKGAAQFLEGAVNRFTFSGHAVRVNPKPIGVTEVRIGVTDRHNRTHYFNCEGWREVGQALARRKAGVELELTCILRRDRDDSKGFQRAFDVMEIQRVAAPAIRPALANAAD